MTNEQAKAIFLLEYCSQNCGTQYRRHCDKCEINLAIKALEKQEKIKEAFENWEIDTSGFFGADDETTEFIFAVKKILRAGEQE